MDETDTAATVYQVNLPNSRNLRRKERKVYNDEGIDDDEIEGKRMFSLDEKLNCDTSMEKFYLEMKGSDLTLKYFQTHGFSTPILIRDKTGLGLRIPSKNFSVNDVKKCVGSSRVLDVMDVNTQKDLEMTVKDWVRYYDNPVRERLLNVISLEFSHTQLENYVDQPEVIHQMDWVDLVWPWYLKEYHTESTNILARMKYPKVQKYCLMSVGGCYTDFHIDMGGTSVWYHILRGKKIFWLIPPTDENLTAYENWTLSGRQGDIFFGDIASVCHRITLEAGFTFLIPTGWIHAVYTPEDSLVFGGNFLHCFNIRMQLRIWEVETKTKVPAKFRYPLFGEIHWYVLERYVGALLGRCHRVKTPEELSIESGEGLGGAFETDLRGRDLGGVGDVEVGGVTRLEGEEEGDITASNQDDDDANFTTVEGAGERRQNIFDVMTLIFSRTTAEQSPFCVGDPFSSEGLRSDGTGLAVTSTNHSSASNDCLDFRFKNDLPKPDSLNSRNTFDDGIDRRISGLKADSRQPSRAEKRGSVGGELGGEVRRHRNMLRCELEGLEAIVDWLEQLPLHRRYVPKDIPDPDALLADTRLLLDWHVSDDPEEAITGRNILKVAAIKPPKQKKKKHARHSSSLPAAPSARGAGPLGGGGMDGGGWKYRRVRCKTCEPCTRTNCGECVFCRDMVKYGGPGRVKQTCVSRQCLGPVLPTNAVCQICQQAPCALAPLPFPGSPSSPPLDEECYEGQMMECRVCFEVVHPACLREVCGGEGALSHGGVVDEDVPSSWECARCCSAGKQGQGKHRPAKYLSLNPRPYQRRHQSSDSDDSDDCGKGLSAPPKHRMGVGPQHGGGRGRGRIEEAQKTYSKQMKLNPVVKITAIDQSYPSNLVDQSYRFLSDEAGLCSESQLTDAQSHAQPTRSGLFATFDSPLAELPSRTNSRGREISTPRRYLV